MTTKTKRSLDPETDKRIAALVAFFSGSDVGDFSIKLSVGGSMGEQAKRYFAAREALGVQGWDLAADAEQKIRVSMMRPKLED